jgi:hypothetical protein
MRPAVTRISAAQGLRELRRQSDQRGPVLVHQSLSRLVIKRGKS